MPFSLRRRSSHQTREARLLKHTEQLFVYHSYYDATLSDCLLSLEARAGESHNERFAATKS